MPFAQPGKFETDSAVNLGIITSIAMLTTVVCLLRNHDNKNLQGGEVGVTIKNYAMVRSEYRTGMCYCGSCCKTYPSDLGYV